MTQKFLAAFWMASLCGFLMAVVPVVAEAEESSAEQTHGQQIGDWRKRRHERLSSDDGWLTLVGLEWLQEGGNTVGNSPGHSIRIPGGPEDWGTIYLEGDELRFVPAGDNGVTVDGSEVSEARLVADSQGEPTVVRSGNLSFYVIFRGSYGLRVKDTNAKILQEFTGVRNYEIQADWKVDTRFIPAEEGQTIPIANVLGQVNPWAWGMKIRNRCGSCLPTGRVGVKPMGRGVFFTATDYRKTEGWWLISTSLTTRRVRSMIIRPAPCLPRKTGSTWQSLPERKTFIINPHNAG
jgi:hypothetical protein